MAELMEWTRWNVPIETSEITDNAYSSNMDTSQLARFYLQMTSCFFIVWQGSQELTYPLYHSILIGSRDLWKLLFLILIVHAIDRKMNSYLSLINFEVARQILLSWNDVKIWSYIFMFIQFIKFFANDPGNFYSILLIVWKSFASDDVPTTTEQTKQNLDTIIRKAIWFNLYEY